jgi:hypothetical protein
MPRIPPPPGACGRGKFMLPNWWASCCPPACCWRCCRYARASGFPRPMLDRTMRCAPAASWWPDMPFWTGALDKQNRKVVQGSAKGSKKVLLRIGACRGASERHPPLWRFSTRGLRRASSDHICTLVIFHKQSCLPDRVSRITSPYSREHGHLASS